MAKIYTKEEFNNLQSGQRETILKAETTFITRGEEVYLLKDLLDGLLGVKKIKKEKNVSGAKVTMKKK